ncbi:MAG TPA: type-F conjugative transfer system secretin TraK [Thermodesulfobacteriota bacterium]|nr:type-F conjugative transfer system secretin TraK [Thermodesulfobacteriota bacterium]
MNSIKLVVMVVSIFLLANKVWATTVIEAIDEDKSIFVTVSSRDINRIEMPEPVIEALSSKAIDVKIKERNIFVKVPDSHPAELFISTKKKNISLILVPKDIPAETIVVRDTKDGLSTSSWNFVEDNSYEGTIKKIMLFLFKRSAPSGYIASYPKDEGWMLNGVSLRKAYVIEGPVFQGELYEIKNISSVEVNLSEEMFYQKGIMAISIDKYDLATGETCKLFIVKRSRHD